LESDSKLFLKTTCTYTYYTILFNYYQVVLKLNLYPNKIVKNSINWKKNKTQVITLIMYTYFPKNKVSNL